MIAREAYCDSQSLWYLNFVTKSCFNDNYTMGLLKWKSWEKRDESNQKRRLESNTMNIYRELRTEYYRKILMGREKLITRLGYCPSVCIYHIEWHLRKSTHKQSHAYRCDDSARAVIDDACRCRFVVGVFACLWDDDVVVVVTAAGR